MEPATEIIELPEVTNVVTVYGADSYIGAHLVRHLETTGRMIYGFSQNKTLDFDDEPILTCGREKIPFEPHPVISDWIIVCLDPSIGLKSYIAKMKKLCDTIVKRQYWGRVCFVSGSSTCRTTDQAFSTGENLLNTMLYQADNQAGVLVVRTGDIYGDEIGMSDAPGMITRLLRNTGSGKKITMPLKMDAKRPRIHIADICESIIDLINLGDLAPSLVNIPDEMVRK